MLLELSRITKSYGDRTNLVPVLHGIDLAVAAGDFCAITGPSGSGKSTLLNIVGLLDRPSSGQLSIDDRPIDFSSQVETARQRNGLLGFIFQSFHLLPRLTAWQNVALPLLYRRLPAAERRSRAIAMLGRVGLAERADHVPAALSGGQRQRVAIARALVGGPRILLADEPTGSLDSHTAAEIVDMLIDLNGRHGVSIVMVTHDLALARRCGRQVELLDGRVVDDRRLPG